MGGRNSKWFTSHTNRVKANDEKSIRADATCNWDIEILTYRDIEVQHFILILTRTKKQMITFLFCKKQTPAWIFSYIIFIHINFAKKKGVFESFHISPSISSRPLSSSQNFSPHLFCFENLLISTCWFVWKMQTNWIGHPFISLPSPTKHSWSFSRWKWRETWQKQRLACFK